MTQHRVRKTIISRHARPTEKLRHVHRPMHDTAPLSSPSLSHRTTYHSTSHYGECARHCAHVEFYLEKIYVHTARQVDVDSTFLCIVLYNINYFTFYVYVKIRTAWPVSG